MTNFTFSVTYEKTASRNALTPTVCISSDCPAETAQFYQMLCHFGFSFKKVLSYDNDKKQIIIHPKPSLEEPGAFCNIVGVVAIDFVYPELRNIFLMYFPQLKKIGTYLERDLGGSSFYFCRYVTDRVGFSIFYGVEKSSALDRASPHKTITIPSKYFENTVVLFEELFAVINSTNSIYNKGFAKALQRLVDREVDSMICPNIGASL